MALTMTPAQKLVFKVSDTGWSAVEDLCQSQARLATAAVDSEEASDAYSAYTMRKRELIEYISSLELQCRIPRESRVMSVFVNLLPRSNAATDSKDPDAWKKR